MKHEQKEQEKQKEQKEQQKEEEEETEQLTFINRSAFFSSSRSKLCSNSCFCSYSKL